MKVHENAEVVKVNLGRRAFTKHGQVLLLPKSTHNSHHVTTAQ